MLYSYDNYFSISDILSAVTWLIILSVFVFYKSSKLETKRLARLYIWNFYFKVFFALVFAVYYIVVVNGGDTLGYWEGAKCIQNLLLEDPFKGIEHLFTTPTRLNIFYFFNTETGIPPFSMYLEPETYFVSKITAILSLFTLKSYLATTLIFAFIFSSASWKIFEMTEKMGFFNSKFSPLAALYIPSVSFWCAGVSKDAIILISIFYIFHFLYLITTTNQNKYYSLLMLLVYTLIIYNTRNFILASIIIPLFVVGLARLNKLFKVHRVLKSALNLMLFTTMIFLGVSYLSSSTGEELFENNTFIQEALIVQQDFSTNKLYGKNQYSLGEIDKTPEGIVKAIPISIFSGIFQPLPWNGLSISLILNAIESFVLISVLLYLIFSGKFFPVFKQIMSNEVLIFMLVFVIIIAFMSGFTSIIYGVLVRIRAPLLPFFGLLLLTNTPTSRHISKDK